MDDRWDRRRWILESRRSAAPDARQLAAEAAPRARAARLVRGALATGRDVIVRHARWAAVPWWLEDLAVDLAVDPPWMQPTIVDLGEITRGDAARLQLPDVLAQALGVGGLQAMVATSREAFRERTGMVLRKARSRRRHVLLCARADHLGYALLQDLCDAVAAARAEMTPGTSPLVVLACRHGGQSLDLPDAVSFLLPDPSREEAVRLAAELAGGHDRDLLDRIVDTVGPVPEFLQSAVARGALDGGREHLRERMAPELRELDQAVAIVSAQPELAGRLELLAQGPQPFDQQPDWALLRSGLVTVDDRVGARITRLRSPLVPIQT